MSKHDGVSPRNFEHSSVRVRMYRMGLGDCFLLTFPGTSRHIHVLIDCGVLQGKKNAAQKMQRVMRDIVKTTGGHLDLLVVTHEHWDHVSGFQQAQEEFESLQIDHLWLAWTEDPTDNFANDLRQGRSLRLHGLRLAAKQLKEAFEKRSVLRRKSGAEDITQRILREYALQQKKLACVHEGYTRKDEKGLNYPPLGMPEDIPRRPEPKSRKQKDSHSQNLHGSIENVLSFFGATTDSAFAVEAEVEVDQPEGRSKISQTANALKIVRDQVNQQRVRGRGRISYLQPGEVRSLPGDKSRVNCFVLGPPRNAWIKRSNATKAEIRNQEAYGHAFSFGQDASFFRAVESHEDDAQGQAFQPFTDAWSIDLTTAEKTPFFEERYYDELNAWRQIDDDWLGSAGPLALKLDSDTNNTSLVLAFELEPGGDVLLFPGDAQVGSWRSWLELSEEWESHESKQKTKRSVKDLLRRTVLYKVGHHGSHNATLPHYLRDFMQRDELTAMIPVDKSQAKSKGWRMPFEQLHNDLRTTTGWRVLVADEDFPERNPDVSDPAWQEWRERVKYNGDLQVEYWVPLSRQVER